MRDSASCQGEPRGPDLGIPISARRGPLGVQEMLLPQRQRLQDAALGPPELGDVTEEPWEGTVLTPWFEGWGKGGTSGPFPPAD